MNAMDSIMRYGVGIKVITVHIYGGFLSVGLTEQ